MFEKKQRYPAFFMILLATLAIVAGCSSQRSKAVLDLVPLSLRLEDKFKESSMVVELEDRDTLGITVVDATADGLIPNQAAERAHDIASFVCENYHSMDEIDRVWVTFESHHDKSIADNTGSVTYSFEDSALVCSRH